MKYIYNFYNFILKILFLFKTKILGYRSIPNFNNINSYNDEDLIGLILKKTLIFKEKIKTISKSDRIFLDPQNLIIKKKLNFNKVLDLGGGFGYHYFIFQNFNFNKNLSWDVIETPTLTKIAKKYNNEKKLKFVSKTNKFNSYDLLFCSASICYLPDGIKFIENMIKKHNFRYVYFTRTPLIKSKKNLKIHQLSLKSEHGPGVLTDKYYLDSICKTNLTVFSYDNFINVLKKNYTIISIQRSKKNVFKIDNNKVYDYCLSAERIN